jgi:hypothetical protein
MVSNPFCRNPIKGKQWGFGDGFFSSVLYWWPRLRGKQYYTKSKENNAMQFSISGVFFIIVLIAIGFAIGKRKPDLLGGYL